MRYRGRSVISMNALLLVVLGFHVLRKQRGRRSVEADGRVDCRWNEMVNFLHIEHVHFHLLLWRLLFFRRNARRRHKIIPRRPFLRVVPQRPISSATLLVSDSIWFRRVQNSVLPQHTVVLLCTRQGQRETATRPVASSKAAGAPGLDGTQVKARRSKRRRRWGRSGRGVPSQPTTESGGASSGAEPGRKRILAYFWVTEHFW